MKCYKIKVGKRPEYVVMFSEITGIIADIRELKNGEKMTITVVEISEKEYAAMPLLNEKTV